LRSARRSARFASALALPDKVYKISDRDAARRPQRLLLAVQRAK
jgi:hypothetical protein